MRQHIDNLHEVVRVSRLRIWAFILLGLVTLVSGLGIPLGRLHSIDAEQRQGAMNTQRLAVVREERRKFDLAGGPAAIRSLTAGSIGGLPSEVSRIDLHGAVTLLAAVCDLHISALTVGEFLATDAETIDDAVAHCELSLTARGNPAGLSKLVSLLCQLGYPAVIEDFRLSRGSIKEHVYQINATLGLFQSIPLPETTAPDIAAQQPPR